MKEINIKNGKNGLLQMAQRLLLSGLLCLCTISLKAQDGRLDSLRTTDGIYTVVLQNHLDTSDILRLSHIASLRGDSVVYLGDTTLQMEHQFYKFFYLEFDQGKIYKYVMDFGNNTRHYVYTDDFTMPKGGRIALARCLYGQVSYPEQAYQLRVEGMAFVQAYIDEKGCVTRARPLSNLGYGIEQEMMKAVVKCGCTYVPGKRDGVKVKSIWNIPMRFEL